MDYASLMSQMGGGGGADMKALEEMMAGMSEDDVAAYYAEMQGAMEELAKMSPDELASSMAAVMDSPEIKGMISDPSAILESMRGTGVVSDEQIDEYLANPEKYAKEVEAMTQEMMKVFTDPEAMSSIVEMMQGVGDILADPAKLEEAMLDIIKELDDWESALSDDEKVRGKGGGRGSYIAESTNKYKYAHITHMHTLILESFDF